MSKNNDFTKEYKKLKEIVEWFESDSLDIDKAMDKFEEGMKIAKDLKKTLTDAESKIEELKVKFE